MKHIYLLYFLLHSVISAAVFIPPSSSPKDWKVESISITKSDSKEELKYLGDYIVVAKFRNVSNKPIKIAVNHVSTFICGGQLSDKEFSVYLRERNRIHHVCCHPPHFVVIEPNQVHTISCRNSSKYEGKKMNLSTGGKNGAYFTIGSYTLKLTKMGQSK